MEQWFNELLPIQNDQGMRNIAVLRVAPNATGVDLRTLFGNPSRGMPTAPKALCTPSGPPNVDAGHFYTIQADAANVYLALSHSIRDIDETYLGTASGCCWKLPSGDKIRGRIPAGREYATGVATMPVYSVLNFKTLSGSGYLRIYRSSLGLSETTEEFAHPYVKF